MTNDFQYVSFNLSHVYIATLVYMIWIFFFLVKISKNEISFRKKKTPLRRKCCWFFVMS